MGLLLPTPPVLQTTTNDGALTSLVLVVVNAILEVFFLCLVGWVLARKGIVDDKAKKTLNKINVSLFTPALLFSKVAFSLSPDKLKDLIIIPVGFAIITCFPALVAFALGSAVRLKRGQRNFAIACTMFQNSNSLPIALMQSLIGEKMPLQWGPHDDKDQMLGRALSYLVLFSTLGIIVRWSIGVRLLTSAETEHDDDESTLPSNSQETLYSHEHDDEHHAGDHTPLINHNGNGNGLNNGKLVRNRLSTVSFTGADDEQARQAGHQPKRANSKPIFQSFPNTPVPSQHTSSTQGSEADEDEEDDDPEWGVRHGAGRRDDEDDIIFRGIWVVRWKKFKRAMGRVFRPVKRLGKKIGAFMTVPLWAALLSLVVACIPPLQHWLNEAEPLKSAIKNAGNCSVPVTLITLGAYFYRPTPPNARPFYSRINPFSHDTRPIVRSPSAPGETRTVLVAVVSRMIVVPLVMIPLFGWYAKQTVNVADDPVFVVVACLLIGSPTAITLAQITSSASGDVFEKLISRTLFVSYAILTAPTTIALVLAALFIDKIQ